MVEITDFAQPPEPEKSAELDKRIIDTALKRAGLEAAPSYVTPGGKFPEPVQDYGAQALQKRLNDAYKAGIAEALTFAIATLEKNGLDVGIRQIKEFGEKVKDLP